MDKIKHCASEATVTLKKKKSACCLDTVYEKHPNGFSLHIEV